MNAAKDLQGMKVAVLASDGFEESELLEPVDALREAGATVSIVGPKAGKIQGFRHLDKGAAVDADLTLNDLDPSAFDAVMLPGGTVNADTLRSEPAVKRFLVACARAGKPIAAICHAPWELASAGLLEGRRLTSYHTIQDDLVNAGAQWSDTEVVVDGNLVTSRQPDDIPAFNAAMLKVFGAYRASHA